MTIPFIWLTFVLYIKTMETSTDNLKLRVLQAKAKIPHEINYTSIYQHLFGKQSEKDLNRIREVWNLRIADANITNKIEIISEQYTK